MDRGYADTDSSTVTYSECRSLAEPAKELPAKPQL